MGNNTDQLEEQLEQAKEQLHQTLTEVNERAEAVGDQLQPERLLERYALPAVCAAGAAGLLLGAIDDNFLALGLMVAGGLLGLASRPRKTGVPHTPR
ncbi:MAG TPA: hypothetical protein VNF27_05270 [Candidatus Binataceae bacterium]|nr:hypothetical protein [Candidatus Binataceae bacterium]